MSLKTPQRRYIGEPAEKLDIGKEENIRQSCVESMNTADSWVLELCSSHAIQAIFEGGGVVYEKGQTLIPQVDTVVLHLNTKFMRARRAGPCICVQVCRWRQRLHFLAISRKDSTLRVRVLW